MSNENSIKGFQINTFYFEVNCINSKLTCILWFLYDQFVFFSIEFCVQIKYVINYIFFTLKCL